MISIRICLIVAVTFALAACQLLPSATVPPEPAPVVVEAPTVKPQDCPVCPALECPEPQIREKVVTEYLPAPVPVPSATDPTLVGAVEWAFVEPGDILVKARIDTGAETSSIHAQNIRLLEKDGKRYVRFDLENPETQELIAVERRLHRRIIVKQTGDMPPDRRYVVRMWVTVGSTRTWLDVSLTDRDDFDYAMLLGRDMLMDEFIVDVSKRYTQPKKQLETD